MNINNRISRLETNQDHRGPASDEDVLAAIETGQVDDRHVDWIDSIVRAELLTTICTWALVLRYSRSMGQPDPYEYSYGVGVGARVVAARSNQAVADHLEQALTSRIFTTSLPGHKASAAFFSGAEDPQSLAQMWVRSRLVYKLIGNDLGRALRGQLDRYELQPGPLLLPFDAHRPPDHRLARVERFGAALFTLRADIEFPLDPEVRGEVARLAEAPTKAEG